MVQRKIRMLCSDISHMPLHFTFRDSGVTQKHGYFFINPFSSFWLSFGLFVVYQRTWPSFLAAAISCSLASANSGSDNNATIKVMSIFFAFIVTPPGYTQANELFDYWSDKVFPLKSTLIDGSANFPPIPVQVTKEKRNRSRSLPDFL